MPTKVKDTYTELPFVFRKWIDKEKDLYKEWWVIKDHDGSLYLKIVGIVYEGAIIASFVRYEKSQEFMAVRGRLKCKKWHKIKLPDEMLVAHMGQEHVYYDKNWNLDDRWSPLNVELEEKEKERER